MQFVQIVSNQPTSSVSVPTIKTDQTNQLPISTVKPTVVVDSVWHPRLPSDAWEDATPWAADEWPAAQEKFSWLMPSGDQSDGARNGIYFEVKPL